MHQTDGIIRGFAAVVMNALDQGACTISDSNDCHFDFAHNNLVYLRSSE